MYNGKMLKNTFYFLHGQTPHIFDVICVYIVGLMCLLVLYRLQPLSLTDWCLAFLAADIAGGIISNATASTREQWQRQSSNARTFFLVLHLLIHPLIIVLLNGFNSPLSLCLLGGLVVKVLLFLAGGKVSKVKE